MVMYAGSRICIVHADMTFTRPRLRSRSCGNDRQPPFGAFIMAALRSRCGHYILQL